MALIHPLVQEYKIGPLSQSINNQSTLNNILSPFGYHMLPQLVSVVPCTCEFLQLSIYSSRLYQCSKSILTLNLNYRFSHQLCLITSREQCIETHIKLFTTPLVNNSELPTAAPQLLRDFSALQSSCTALMKNNIEHKGMKPITTRFISPTMNTGYVDYPSFVVEVLLHTQVQGFSTAPLIDQTLRSTSTTLATTQVHEDGVHWVPTWTLSHCPPTNHKLPITIHTWSTLMPPSNKPQVTNPVVASAPSQVIQDLWRPFHMVANRILNLSFTRTLHLLASNHSLR